MSVITGDKSKNIVDKIHLIPGQANIIRDYDSAILAAIAGTGGGKTQLMYWWLLDRMEAFPGRTWAIAEPSYPMLEKVLAVSSDPNRPSLIQFFQRYGHHPEYVKGSLKRIIQTDHGQIYLGSADNPDSMQGAAVSGYCLDEAGQMTLLAFETAFQRVSMMQGQVLITTTPYNLGWLKTNVFEKDGQNGIHVETWKSIDRRGFPRESYELAKKILPPWRFAMMYDAVFQRPAGLIYEAFNEQLCIIDRFDIPKEWLVYVGHDFGPDNPAALFYARVGLEVPDRFIGKLRFGDMIAFNEYLPGQGKSLAQRCEEYKEIISGRHVAIRMGGSPQEEETRQGYAAHGWPIVQPRIGHVEPQIERVIGMHQLNRIYSFSDMYHYLDEKRSFSRVLDDENQPTEKIDKEPRFHLMACERYLMTEFQPETVEVAGETISVKRWNVRGKKRKRGGKHNAA